MSPFVKASRTPAVAGRVPRTRSAGVREASGEETAGGLGAAVRAVLWLQADSPAISPVHLLYPQTGDIQGPRPLSCRLHLLYPQEQTFKVVSPKVCS